MLLQEISHTRPFGGLGLKHKTTGAERHYKASARFKKIDDSGHFETLIKPIPEDFEEWDLVSMVLEK